MTNPVEVRADLVRKLRRDLVGPGPGPEDADLEREVLDVVPSRWYLTGYLAPQEELRDGDAAAAAEDEERDADADQDGLAEGNAAEPGTHADDDQPAEGPVTVRRYRPSSIGLTVLVPAETTSVDVVVTWGDYRTEPPLDDKLLLPVEEAEEKDGKSRSRPSVNWVRVPRGPVRVSLPLVEGRSDGKIVPDSAGPRPGGGLVLVTHVRGYEIELPDRSRERLRAVTVFILNQRREVHRRYQDLSYAFQVRLELESPAGFRPRHDLSGWQSTDEDVRLADLHYRDVCDYGVGRGTSAGWAEDEDGIVRRAWTEPMPAAHVERVVPNEKMDDVERSMEALAELAAASGDQLAAKLLPLVTRYRRWIETERQRAEKEPAPARCETARQLVARASKAADRIEAGIALLRADANARTAFRLMNEAIAAAARHRNAGRTGDPQAKKPPTWRPFQLAFILLNLQGLVDRGHADREVADLLFFPTGGGKTEAYLGLAAFTIALRRIRASGMLGAGVSVIMRYTLRLLTLDQLSRASGVICALELARQAPQNSVNGHRLLGDWPIEIGLWVGSDASPNRLGGKGDTGDDTAVTRVRKYRSGRDKRAPAPVKACPWCSTPFTPDSFHCVPNVVSPTDLELRCVNVACDFGGKRLPVLTVDEPIYRRLPSFVIATVDKFASLPWVGEAGAFFGHVDRFDPAVGFFGAAEQGGQKLFNDHVLDAPDLIIQDELHLISGPLGTVAGLYETAIDSLCSRIVGERRIRPKIVASTATVRRASAQIRALFDRHDTQVFPPPGVDRSDSFFAQTDPDADEARLYVGIAAQGRGPKLIFRQTLTTLLCAAEAAAKQDVSTADPYLTAVCYFNALRELGGARRIVEDEVRRYAATYGADRQRIQPVQAPFTDRKLGAPMELTSRVSTDEVAEAKARLEQPFGSQGETVDVALATNMISVGLDIGRLGLMLVQGQPKTTAEYIQATSRVGREAGKPGVVAALLNLHKPRDRAHFEQFTGYHRAFYRAVEATSVTPWARRALDRALAAVVVSIGRHLDPELTPDTAVERLSTRPDLRAKVRAAIVDRAPQSERTRVGAPLDKVLDDWMETAREQTAEGGSFVYADASLPRRLLVAPLDPALPNLSAAHRHFVANRSMRDVEPNVVLKILGPDGQKIVNAQDVP
jgi:hypothetical protein